MIRVRPKAFRFTRADLPRHLLFDPVLAGCCRNRLSSLVSLTSMSLKAVIARDVRPFLVDGGPDRHHCHRQWFAVSSRNDGNRLISYSQRYLSLPVETHALGWDQDRRV